MPEHVAQMAAHGIAPIDLLVAGLYPFEQTVARGAGFAECVEQIDIGGPAMIRAAAKNHDFVAVLTEPAQYAAVLAELAAHGGTTPCHAAAARGARPMRAPPPMTPRSRAWFAQHAQSEAFPPRLAVAGTLRQTLRYGENPHQRAAFYATGEALPGIATAAQVQGKELSYNNFDDTDAAFECVAEFEAPTVVIVKHANPCGVATAATLAEAWDAALALRSGLGVRRHRRGQPHARRRDGRAIGAIFTEVIVAPDADEDARAVLARKEEPAPAADRRNARSGGGRARVPQPRRWVSGADPRYRARGRGGAAGGDAARADAGRAPRPDLRFSRLQAREVERDRLCEGSARRSASAPAR